MSFDLFVYINDPSTENLRSWKQKLQEVGVECQFPERLSINELISEMPVKCRLVSPLTNDKTIFKESDFFLESIQVNKDRLSELIENTNDNYLIEKLKESTTEIVVSVSTTDEQEWLTIACYTSATLADACDGVLFDPQKFGGVYGDECYKLAQYYTKFDKPRSPDSKKTQESIPETVVGSNKTFLGSIFKVLKSNPMFSPYATSVKKYWRDNAKEKLSAQNKLKSKSGMKFIQKLENDDSRKPNPSYALSCLIYLNLFKPNKRFIQWHMTSLNTIGNRVYKTTAYEDTKIHNDHPIMVAYSAIDRLQCYLSLACAKTLLNPSVPDKIILMEGIVDIDTKLKECKGGFDEITHKASLLCGVLLLIVEEDDLALKFMTRHKTRNEIKSQAQMLIALAKDVLKLGKGNLSQKMEADYFEIFNAYRLPVYGQTVKALNNEPLLISDSIGNYLFSWLYLVVFKNQQHSTWKELKNIMIS